jgi:hypothetical protein
VPTFTTKTYTNAKPLPLPQDALPAWVAIDVEFKSTTYAGNDMILLASLPAGVKVLDWACIFPDIDSGGPTFAFSLGVALNDGSDLSAEVWGTGITAGQSTAIVRNTTSVAAQADLAGLSTQFNASGGGERQVAMKITTAATTYAGSGKTGQVMLLLQA